MSSSEPKQKKSKKSTATRSKMEARVASREPTAEDYINACSRDLSIVLERIDPLMTGFSRSSVLFFYHLVVLRHFFSIACTFFTDQHFSSLEIIFMPQDQEC